MKTLLIANVGNSDLDVTDPNRLPETLRDRRSIRALGDYLSEDASQFAPHVQLPLIGTTLRWLIVERGVSAEDIRLCLCASDQPEHFTRSEERQKDTIGYARAIQKLLSDANAFRTLIDGAPKGAFIPKKQIRVMSIEGNPADYSNMLQDYSEKLPEALRWGDDCDQVYLEISGGTPAMTSMLVVVGVEVFGSRARTLYVDRSAGRPYEVGVAGELFARRTRDTLLTQLRMHAYAVASRTLKENNALISSDERRRSVLTSLIEYADRRLAFDFDGARAALQRARALTTGEDQVKVQFWLGQLEHPQVMDKLVELLHSMRIRHGFGDYADFVQRVFRFQEATFRYMAEQMGLQYSKPNSDLFASSKWLDGVPGLRAFTETYRSPYMKSPEKLDFTRTLNRITLGAIVDFFVQHDASWAQWADATRLLHQFSAVADLRNRGLSGHGFQGISARAIVEAYGDSIEVLFADLAEVFEIIFGTGPGDNPYDQVNEMLERMIPIG